MSDAAALDKVRVRVLPDGLMDRKNAAEYLGHAGKTLAQWAIQGKGPRSVKVGGRVFYFRTDLDEFIRSGSAHSEPRKARGAQPVTDRTAMLTRDRQTALDGADRVGRRVSPSKPGREPCDIRTRKGRRGR
jgi:hypothetical protein